MIIWANGELVDDVTSPLIRCDDHGLTVGDGAFETMEIIDSHAFALDRHLRRLDRSLAALGLPNADSDTLRRGVCSVLAQWKETAGDAPGRIRITVTGGPGPLGSPRPPRDEASPSVLIVAGPMPAPHPVAIWTSPWVRNTRSPLTGVKSTSYAENVVALAHARQRGADEAIFFNDREELCEGTGTNIFLEQDGILITAPLDSGALAGVTRELVLEWATELEIPTRERPIGRKEYLEASHLALTSSTRGLVPVIRRDDKELEPGSASALLGRTYASLARRHLNP